jgi:molybdenum cofactor guanylyltransferase
MYKFPCVIFAGGKSSRMGEDKSLLPFGGFESLTHYQYEKLKKIFERVYISTKNSDKFSFDADFIIDQCSDDLYAPTAGFVAMFNELSDEKIFVISVDTPFVGKSVIDELLHTDHDGLDVTVAQTHGGVHPMCGIYHRSLKDKFEEMLKVHDHKLGQLLKNSHTKFVIFENEELFTNLNHPHEYQEALMREILLKKEIYEFNKL